MDLLLTRSFLAVVDHGTITDAARGLSITQPALSRRIQQLEEQLGVALLERSRRGVQLTAMGRLVSAEGRLLVDRFDQMRESLKAHADLAAGTVRLGGGATAVSLVIPLAIAQFQNEFPAIKFQVKEGGSREIEQEVVAERLELGIVTMPVHTQELSVHTLREDQIVPIAASDHPLARRRQIPVESLDGQGIVGFEAGSAIRQLIDTALREAGVTVNVVMELRSIPAIIQMVATTQNLAFVSALGVPVNDPSVRKLDVAGLAITRKLAVVSKRARPLSPAAAAFSARLHALEA